MRIAVIGAGGQLGSELIRYLQDGPHQGIGFRASQCDVGDRAAVAAVLDDARPDAVINRAAWTNVDAAESAVDAVYRVNALGARVLASECHQRSLLLSHISTDFVFAGTANRPIDEWTHPGPVSVYGRSKWAGECEVRSLASRHQIIRTSWLYGQDGPNFVLTMLRLADRKAPIRVVADQEGSPTWTGHLAPAVVRLLELGLPGTYHMTNTGSASWHTFAEAVMEESGITVPIEPIPSEAFPTAAARPHYSVLDNRAWRLLGEEPLPHWRVALREYLVTRRDLALEGLAPTQ